MVVSLCCDISKGNAMTLPHQSNEQHAGSSNVTAGHVHKERKLSINDSGHVTYATRLSHKHIERRHL